MRSGSTRSCTVTLVATLAWGLAAPALAADAGLPRARRVPLSVTAASLAARADASAVQEAPPATTAPSEETPKSFWKSPKGIVTGILLAGGLGWVFYSKSHDRVKSPGNP